MSKEIRQMIDKVKSFNESLTVDDYMNQLNTNEYLNLSNKLFNDIEDEGWLEQLEEFYKRKFDKTNFKYMTLKLTDNDKQGLINFDDDIIEKFNDFDIKLKSMDKYPFTKLDLIDYDNGIVFIVKLDV
jgi:hypothetical protein